MAAPNVEIREIDLSTRVPSYPGVYGAMVLRATKGPLEPFLVTSETDFLRRVTLYEKLTVDDQDEMRSALAFLEGSNKLWVSRAYSQPIVYDSWEAEKEVTIGDKIKQVSGAPAEGFVWQLTETGGNEPTPLITGTVEPTWGAGPHVAGDEVVETIGVDANEYTLTWTYTAVTAAPLYGGVMIKETGATDENTALAAGIRVDRNPEDTAPDFTDADDAFLLYGADPGDWNNKIAVRIITSTSVVREPGAFIIQVYLWAGSEAWTLKETHTVSMTPGHIDGYGRNIFVEDYLKTSSKYIRAKVNDTDYDPKPTVVATTTWAPRTTYAVGAVVYPLTASASYPNIVFKCILQHTSGDTEPTWVFTEGEDTGTQWTAFYSYDDLEGGDDGSLPATGDMMVAADKLNNAESYPVTVFMSGGYAIPAYQIYLAQICSARKDCVPILCFPLTEEKSAAINGVQDLVTYKGTNYTALGGTSYAALYAGWVKTYDKYTNRELWTDPTGFVGAIISKTAANFELWYPPAGWRRGTLLVLDVYDHYSKGEMDLLYDNNINPIRWNAKRGIAVFGQKTTLSRPSVLDRLIVRLLCCYIEPAIAYALEDYIFEFNNVATRSMVTTMLNSYMQNIKSRNGVSDFMIKCDEENNTAEDIDNHIMNVWVFIKPMQSVEYIKFDLILTREAMTFGLALQQVLNVA